MNGACNSTFLAPGEGSNRQISLNFKDFYIKLCVYSHKFKLYISYRIFVLSLGSCPRDLGVLGSKN